MTPQIIKVLLEYSPSQQRVMMRGCFMDGQQIPEKLSPDNTQNVVQCFLGLVKHNGVGFSGLTISEE